MLCILLHQYQWFTWNSWKRVEKSEHSPSDQNLSVYKPANIFWYITLSAARCRFSYLNSPQWQDDRGSLSHESEAAGECGPARQLSASFQRVNNTQSSCLAKVIVCWFHHMWPFGCAFHQETPPITPKTTGTFQVSCFYAFVRSFSQKHTQLGLIKTGANSDIVFCRVRT